MLNLKATKYGLTKSLIFLFILLPVVGGLQTHAFESYKKNGYSERNKRAENQSRFENRPDSEHPHLNELRGSNEDRFYNQRFAQQNQRNSDYRLRSKSEVVREVKQRYDAEILKISLNQQRETYQVRILLPNGRVKQISVNAQR